MRIPFSPDSVCTFIKHSISGPNNTFLFVKFKHCRKVPVLHLNLSVSRFNKVHSEDTIICIDWPHRAKMVSLQRNSHKTSFVSHFSTCLIAARTPRDININNVRPYKAHF